MSEIKLELFGSHCSETLLADLRGEGDFQPLSSVKRMRPGEGLASIWMCPSDVLSTALFSPSPRTARELHSANLIQSIRRQQSTSDDRNAIHSEDHGSGETESDSEIDSENEEISSADTRSQDDLRVTSLKRKLKETYRTKLSAAAALLLDESISALHLELLHAISEIRQREQHEISTALQPLDTFLQRFQLEVNEENGAKLKKKYKNKRKALISLVIDAADENFCFRCLQLEKRLREEHQFRLQQINNEQYSQHRHNIRAEAKKWCQAFTKEKSALDEAHQETVNAVRQKYQLLNEALKSIEQQQVQKKLNEIMRGLTEVEALDSVTRDEVTSCSEDAAWLCILKRLLKDMQHFVHNYIAPETDLGQLITRIKQQQLKSKPIKRSKTRGTSLAWPAVRGAVPVPQLEVDSRMTVACGRRDERLHQQLVREANDILHLILRDLVPGGAEQKTSRSRGQSASDKEPDSHQSANSSF